MAKYCFVVLSNPVAGREEEYNRWYDKRHLNDVLAVPGFVAAQRFKLAKDDSDMPHKYLALYEIETGDLKKTLRDMYSRAGTDAMPISPALDLQGVSATVYEAVTERVRRP
jgi:hypothetical protein